MKSKSPEVRGSSRLYGGSYRDSGKWRFKSFECGIALNSNQNSEVGFRSTLNPRKQRRA